MQAQEIKLSDLPSQCSPEYTRCSAIAERPARRSVSDCQLKCCITMIIIAPIKSEDTDAFGDAGLSLTKQNSLNVAVWCHRV